MQWSKYCNAIWRAQFIAKLPMSGINIILSTFSMYTWMCLKILFKNSVHKIDEWNSLRCPVSFLLIPCLTAMATWRHHRALPKVQWRVSLKLWHRSGWEMEIISPCCVVIIKCSVLEYDIFKSPFQYSPWVSGMVWEIYSSWGSTLRIRLYTGA